LTDSGEWFGKGSKNSIVEHAVFCIEEVEFFFSLFRKGTIQVIVYNFESIVKIVV
jgi:hypothetical protein